MYILLLLSFPVWGQTTFTSTGGGGDWDTGGTWDQGGSTPGSADNVIIATGDVVTMANTGTRNITNLTLQGSGRLDWTANRRLNVSGDLTMSGTASLTGSATNHRIDVAGNFDIPSGTATIGGVRFTDSGTTTIDGTLSFTSTTGAKTFTDITVNSGGIWDNGNVTETFNIDGSILHNGDTWNGCSNTTGCRYTFRTDGSTISGSDTVYITDIRVNNGVTLTNNGLLVVTDNIDGATAPITGVFVNGGAGVLNLRDNGAYTELTFTLNTVGNTVIYDGTGSESISLGPFYDLEVNKPNITTRVDINGADVTVDRNLTLTRGRMRLNSANTLTVTGNLSITADSEFEPNNSEAIANIGGNLTMSGGLFDHNDGDLNITGDIIITGGTMTMNEATTPVNPSTIDATDMSVATGSVTLSEGTVTLSNASGGLTVSSGSFSKNNAANTLTIAGDYDISGGTNDINSGTISFVNMDITGGGTINVASPTITSTGTITVTNGTYTSDGAGGTYSYNNISVGASGSWVATSPYDPTINGNLLNDGTFTGCSTTSGCNYTLTSATGTISGSSTMSSMSDFILNDGASYTNTNTGGLNITDRLATTSGTGTFVNGLNGVLLYGGSTGNFSITNFTASASPNTVTYNRTGGNQLIEPTTDGFYHNLVIDKADGVDVTTNTVFTINGVLTLTAGDLIMGNQNLIIADGATISGGSSISYIQDSGNGELRQLYSAAGATLSFPIGDTDDYSPINSFTISSAAFGASPFLDFSITDADHPSRDTDNTAAGGDDDGTTAVAFISRFWTVASGDISSPRFNASYTYVDADVTGTEASMVGTVYRTPPGEAFLDWHVAGTVNPVTNTVSVTNVDAFGDLYAMDNTTDRLPIVLVSFDVHLTESTVELEWVTSSEENNDFYTIERSLDAVNFSPILTMEGAGNSEQLMTYNATDRRPLVGRSFYRLKQTDFNGQFEYSEIRSVFYEGSTEAFEINVYPNPVKSGSTLTIKVPPSYATEHLQLKVIDQFGRETSVDHRLVQEGMSVSTSRLKPGIYIMNLTDGNRQARKKVIVR